MGPQDQPNKGSTKRAKCQGLCNNSKRGRSIESMARQTTQGRTHCRVKIKIYSILLLYSKEGQFTMIGSRLQEIKPGHHKGQNATTSNWRSNQQA